MAKLTEQSIFNKVYRGLRKQGFKQSITGSMCAYRGDDGARCAAGHCMPDYVYLPLMENIIICNVLDNNEGGFNAYKLSPLLDKGKRLAWRNEYLPFINIIGSLQRIHDDGDSRKPAVMEAELRNYAARNNLTIPR